MEKNVDVVKPCYYQTYFVLSILWPFVIWKFHCIWVIDVVWGQDGWILAKFFICCIIMAGDIVLHPLSYRNTELYKPGILATAVKTVTFILCFHSISYVFKLLFTEQITAVRAQCSIILFIVTVPRVTEKRLLLVHNFWEHMPPLEIFDAQKNLS